MTTPRGTALFGTVSEKEKNVAKMCSTIGFLFNPMILCAGLFNPMILCAGLFNPMILCAGLFNHMVLCAGLFNPMILCAGLFNPMILCAGLFNHMVLCAGLLLIVDSTKFYYNCEVRYRVGIKTTKTFGRGIEIASNLVCTVYIEDTCGY